VIEEGDGPAGDLAPLSHLFDQGGTVSRVGIVRPQGFVKPFEPLGGVVVVRPQERRIQSPETFHVRAGFQF